MSVIDASTKQTRKKYLYAKTLSTAALQKINNEKTVTCLFIKISVHLCIYTEYIITATFGLKTGIDCSRTVYSYQMKK